MDRTVAFLIALAFGALEMFLLFRLTTAVVRSDRKTMMLALLLKFLTYAAAIGLFVFRFLDYALWCICGFTVGLPVTAVVLFVYRTFFSKKYRGGDDS